MMVFKTTLVLLVLALARSGMALNDIDLKNVFELMAQDAKQVRDDMKPKAKQVLSISVFSDREVESLNLIPTERRRIFLNTPKGSFDEPEYFSNTNAEIHGEIIALYIKDTIKELLDVFDKADKDNKQLTPNIFVYSYFIPCAEVKNVPYSCAEEVAKAARFYKPRSKMFVGYSNIFVGTNEASSTEFLLNSGIKLVDLRPDAIPKENQPSSLQRTLFFQELMHTCLMHQNILCRGHPERDKIIAYLVNLLTKRCTKASLFYGTISTFGLNFLGSCLESEKWQPCCEPHANEAKIKLEVMKCMNSIMHEYKPTAMHRIQFGSVKSLTDTNWTHILDIERKRWSKLFDDLTVTNPYAYDVITISSTECLSVPTKEGKRNAHQFAGFEQKVNRIKMNMGLVRNRNNP